MSGADDNRPDATVELSSEQATVGLECVRWAYENYRFAPDGKLAEAIAAAMSSASRDGKVVLPLQQAAALREAVSTVWTNRRRSTDETLLSALIVLVPPQSTEMAP